jgi:1-acyl-sn-glycerol-3-phosphate acyltransferase
MIRWLRLALIVLLARPLARLLTGADVSGRERLPLKGPAIIAANHNSHLDTLLLLTIFPARALHRLRPAAAADTVYVSGVVNFDSLPNSSGGVHMPTTYEGFTWGNDLY